jgi:hypothetical protein
MELKAFQRKTVDVILKRLKGGAYALADETGLGKTLVCSEVARVLAMRHFNTGSEKPFVAYYVAPSLELLDQNLDSIIGHLAEELKPAGQYQLHKVISRVTQLPLVLCDKGQNKKNVFVVGLSPETSFKISGWGRADERAYLAALFSIYCKVEVKANIVRTFWCLEREPDDAFSNRVAEYAHVEKLGMLLPWRNLQAQQYREFANRVQELGGGGISMLKEQRRLVSQIRKAIAGYLVQTDGVLPDLVLFDEWHKYKTTCFGAGKNSTRHQRLVADLLASMRKTRHSKVLFVSATPFTVDYGQLQSSEGAVSSSDLKSLLQLFWDKEKFEKEYQSLKKKQEAFVTAISRLLRHEAEDELQVLKAETRNRCDEYEAELRRYCVRTERPKAALRGNGAADVLQWTRVFKSGAATAFLCRFGSRPSVRSPVTAMWMDGHTFPEAGYDGLKMHKVSNIDQMHWKVQRLQVLLDDSFRFGEKLHSARRPPLWLWPGARLQGRKHLIFSEFRFVPEEICSVFRAVQLQENKGINFSGSVLGFFPLASSRSIGEKNLQRSIHFPLFYPFLFWEIDPAELAERVRLSRSKLSRLIIDGEYAVPTLLEVEKLLMHDKPEYQRSIADRRTLLRNGYGIKSSARFRQYLSAIVDGGMDAWAPGRAVARVVGDQRARLDYADCPHNAFDEQALRLGEALFHVFVSPEAQMLKKHASVPKKPLPKNWNSFLRFALWYANRYELQKTLQDFANLLEGAGHHGQKVLAEIESSMSLKRGSVGTKFVRSFHDRKADVSTTGREASVSTHSLRSAFNSPFPPYVLASTSVGQEGLDFHRYCDSIIHWTPPSSPAVLRQREGRLDRFRSLQVRIALQKLTRNGARPDDDKHDDLSPDFVVMNQNERLNQPKSEVLYLPFTTQQATWQRCLERMHYDDLLIGAPDPLADERRWLNAIDDYAPNERERRFSLLKEFSISLKPK